MIAPTNGLSIEAILYSNFIKYNKLITLTQQEFAGSNSCNLNVYIDVNMFSNILFRDYISISDENCVAAIVLNYCAHIRAFYKRLGVYTNIILVYSDESFGTNKFFVPDYKWLHQKKKECMPEMVKLENFNMQILELMCNYLPDIYFKKGTVETGVMIGYLMRNDFNNGYPNIVFTKNQYSYQLPCYNECVIFRSKRVKQDDFSYSLNFSNALNVYIQEYKNVQIPILVHKSMISTAFCLLGINKVLKKVFSTKKALNIISNMDPNTYGDIENMYAQMSSIASSKDMLALPQYEFTNRYKCIDLNFQIKMYDTMPESKDTSYIINLEDPDKVKYVNNNYFIKNPIDLQRL